MVEVTLKHPPRLVRASIHVPAENRRLFMIAGLVLLYAFVLQSVYSTIGQPYDNALRELEQISKRNLTVFSREKIGSGPLSIEHSLEDFIVGDEDLDDDTESEEILQEEEDDDAQEFEDLFSEDEMISSEVGKSAKKDLERIKELAKEHDRPLPSQALPSATSAVALFLTISAHVLFHLMCHWQASFKTWALFSPARNVRAGHSILCVPQKHRGKAGISLLQQSSEGFLFFQFQRTIYRYVAIKDAKSIASEETADFIGPSDAIGMIRPVRCPIDCALSHYSTARGLTSVDALRSAQNYGTNRLSVTTPKFFDIWKKQMLSPIAIFQFFSASLWLLDSYWQYTLFTIFSVMMLESTTAFQRLRTLGALNKMTAKPKPVMVFRDQCWKELSAEVLQPGDLISVTVKSATEPTGSAKRESKASRSVVPCDCLILSGSAVVNEATLTGESVPQMKDALPLEASSRDSRRLEINGRDRMHTLFSGTTVMMSSGPSKGAENWHVPQPPNGGCVCYVLRTGFSSAQGEMMQLIEFSMDTVSADNKETFLALFVLLCFALVAAGYVLKKGMEKGERTTHELLLRCVIILTSVVPQHLPLQMAIAVNSALMALMKKGIYCTEPFRVPIAGKVQHCLFDKTGTLTTDQLIAIGVVNVNRGKSDRSAHGASSKKSSAESKRTNKDDWKARVGLVSTHEADNEAQMVLSACHALVNVGDKLVGDPIELSALMGVRWNYDASTCTARPGSWNTLEAAIGKATVELEATKAGSDAHGAIQKRIAQLNENLIRVKRQAMQQGRSIRIVQRHHFASKLQRMSTICRVKGFAGSSKTHCCLVKGSPEAIQRLLVKETMPNWYEPTYRKMAEEGMRVLALAYKWCDEGAVSWKRTEVESELRFAGFIAFSCIVRGDSSTVIRSLRESDHKVTMVTGDQPLTAFHVAKEVAICDTTGSAKEGLQLVVRDASASSMWVKTSEESSTRSIPFDASALPALSQKYHLIITESALLATIEAIDDAQAELLWKHIDCVRVFARMSPQGKSRIVDALQSHSKQHVLMCGDGGNDVGALKQSDIGLALLSGYGNANTAKINNDGDDHRAEKNAVADVDAEDELNRQQKMMAERSKKAAQIRKAAFKKRQAEIKQKQQKWIQEELERLQREGNGGVSAYWTAMKRAMARVQQEMKTEQRKIAKAHGNAAFGIDDEAAAADPFAAMDNITVRPGDASAAAPFTSRAPSVRSVVTLIRQGRCTLLSALQQQQIMVLECIIGAYTLSVLSLEDARSSERQLMASGWLLSIASIAFSYSSPVPKMHRQRPLNSLFHPAICISILGQAAIHLYCMVTAVNMATKEMGEEELAAVREFNRLARLGESEEQDLGDDEDWTAEFMFLWSKPFRPNLLNTVVFLVETAQMNAVLFVNYKGRPWMKGMLENHALFMSVFICVAGVAACAWGMFPEANTMLHLAAFPTDEFRWKVMFLVGTSLIGTFLWDRLVLALFSPGIFRAMLEEASKTTPLDILPVLKSALMVFGGLLLLGTGNPLLWIGAYFLYRRWKK
eukprot:g2306.t1